MKKILTHGSLFAGIGGFELGFEWAGIQTLWSVEIDPYCQTVLRKNFPDTEIYADVRKVHGVNSHANKHGEIRGQSKDGQGGGAIKICKNCITAVDILSGGFPCQDISVAGKQEGIDGERSGLWSEFDRIIGELEPNLVVIENVANLVRLGLERVLSDLAKRGYDAEWQIISANDVGAPHLRKRIIIVAYPSNINDGRSDTGKVGRQIQKLGESGSRNVMANAQGDGFGSIEHNDTDEIQQPNRQNQSEVGSRKHAVADTEKTIRRRSNEKENQGGRNSEIRGCDISGSGIQHWPAEPDLGGMVDGLSTVLDGKIKFRDGERDQPVPRVAMGISNRAHRLKGLGNAIVPQIAELIGNRLVEITQEYS